MYFRITVSAVELKEGFHLDIEDYLVGLLQVCSELVSFYQHHHQSTVRRASPMPLPYIELYVSNIYILEKKLKQAALCTAKYNYQLKGNRGIFYHKRYRRYHQKVHRIYW